MNACIQLRTAWCLEGKIIDSYSENDLELRDCNPFALGKRWLAYSPEKLDIGQQSLGGYFSTGSQSYTATMLSAAKTLGKGSLSKSVTVIIHM